MKRLGILLAVLVTVAAPVSAQVIFQTGFEAPDYTTGDITGQQGWQTNSTNFTVTGVTDFVISGAQSLLVTGNAGRLGHHSLTGAGNYMTIELKMAKAAANAGGWWVALQKSDGSARSSVFGFNAGSIQYYKGGPGWTTYSSFNGGQVYNFKAEVNIPAKTWSLWVDGNLVEQDMPTYSSAPLIPDDVYFYRGYLSLSGLPSYANYAVADDLKVTTVPEPMSLLALAAGLGTLTGLKRRRS